MGGALKFSFLLFSAIQKIASQTGHYSWVIPLVLGSPDFGSIREGENYTTDEDFYLDISSYSPQVQSEGACCLVCPGTRQQWIAFLTPNRQGELGGHCLKSQQDLVSNASSNTLPPSHSHTLIQLATVFALEFINEMGSLTR